MDGVFILAKKRQNFLYGAFILICANIIVKIIGALFKIPLLNLIGSDGMGYFTTAYGLYQPVFILSTAGLPVAVARMVSKDMALKKYREVRKIFRVSFAAFVVTGLAGFLTMYFCAHAFVRLVGNEEAFLCILVMSPSIFFCSVMSAYRGYYQGLQNMYPTAVSQVIEALCKLLLGFALAMWCVKQGMGLAAAAAGAMGGITVGSLLGCIFLMLRHRIKGDGIISDELNYSQKPAPVSQIVKELLKIAIPVAIGSIVLQLTNIIDLFSVMNRLTAAGFGRQRNSIWGCYQGMAVTVSNLVPAITVMFGVSAMPVLTRAWTLQNRTALRLNIESILRITAVIVIPAGFALISLPGEIMGLLFYGRPQDVAAAAPLLGILGIAVIFISFCSLTGSMLQAVGKPDIPVFAMLAGGMIKLVSNYILVGIPSINIKGATIGTTACYIVILIINFIWLCKAIGFTPNPGRIVLKPSIASAFCAAASYETCRLALRMCSQTVSTLIALFTFCIIYLILLFLLRIFSKNDIKMLPRGEKIARILEKLKWIG